MASIVASKEHSLLGVLYRPDMSRSLRYCFSRMATAQMKRGKVTEHTLNSTERSWKEAVFRPDFALPAESKEQQLRELAFSVCGQLSFGGRQKFLLSLTRKEPKLRFAELSVHLLYGIVHFELRNTPVKLWSRQQTKVHRLYCFLKQLVHVAVKLR